MWGWFTCSDMNHLQSAWGWCCRCSACRCSEEACSRNLDRTPPSAAGRGNALPREPQPAERWRLREKTPLMWNVSINLYSTVNGWSCFYQTVSAAPIRSPASPHLHQIHLRRSPAPDGTGHKVSFYAIINMEQEMVVLVLIIVKTDFKRHLT